MGCAMCVGVCVCVWGVCGDVCVWGGGVGGGVWGVGVCVGCGGLGRWGWGCMCVCVFVFLFLFLFLGDVISFINCPCNIELPPGLLTMRYK